jgi:hypothetical protein
MNPRTCVGTYLVRGLEIRETTLEMYLSNYKGSWVYPRNVGTLDVHLDLLGLQAFSYYVGWYMWM